MRCRFEWKKYNRRFRKSLKTAYGIRETRQGIIIRFENEAGKVSFSECSPLEGFSNESLDECVAYLEGLNGDVNMEARIARGLPSLASAFSFGKMHLDNSFSGVIQNTAYLGSFEEWKGTALIFSGYSTLKLKIGVGSVTEEIRYFHEWMDSVGDSKQIRLDANCGLSDSDWEIWKKVIFDCPQVEFMEQPFEHSYSRFGASTVEATKVALDEELSNWSTLRQYSKEGWNGYFVAKPLLMGDSEAGRAHVSQFIDRFVLSSSLESVFGCESILQFIFCLDHTQLPSVGLGTSFLFEQDLLTPMGIHAELVSQGYPVEKLEAVWGNM